MNEPDDILVVEDDADMVEMTVMILNKAGYAVRSARNGKEALEAVATRMPALILLDMLMPVMDGWEFARQLEARYGRVVPVAVVTAAEHAGARADEIGAEYALSKPFDVEDLLRIVARCVGTERGLSAKNAGKAES